jgi:4-amino-4-deoxy-L-arabinose transferase-like glycosyltransferase
MSGSFMTITRERILLGIAIVLGAVLLAGLAIAGLRETPQSNSYALLADAFLNGRLWVNECFDPDCARFEGRQYVIFPPFPAVLTMPFVALFGTGFSGFIFFGAALFAASVVLWSRILRRLQGGLGAPALLLLAGIGFASPLYFVTIRADGVWFLAQSVGFFLISLSLWLALSGRGLIWAGLALGLAFLSRQMSILYLPFLFALVLADDEPLISFRREHFARALKLGLPVLGAVLIYLYYNYVRFGGPTNTGYGFMEKPEGGLAILNLRINESGLFSPDFLLFNLTYLFAQGFDLAFGGPDLLTPEGMDWAGTSLLAASPFVLFAFFAPGKRVVWVGLATIAAMVVPMLFYHSNGFTQFNVQRYTLDWLPILFIILAMTLRARKLEGFGLFVVVGIGLNVATMAVLALIQGGL